MAICPKCHQPIACERLGVRMPPLKARILDMIKAAGDIGISSRELHYDLRPGTPYTCGVRMHVQQINELLQDTDWIIAAEGPRPQSRWCLRRRRRVRRVA